MKAKDFDYIIDSIEENIKVSWPEIEERLKKQLGLTACDIGDIFKVFWPEDLTVNNYYKIRKACRTLQAGAESPNESIENIAFEFGYTEYSTFFRMVKTLYKTSPKEIIMKGNYKIPEIKHLADILSEDSELIKCNRVSSKKEGYDERWRKNSLIADITEMRDRVSEIKKKMREVKSIELISGMEGEILSIQDRIEEAEDRLKIISQDQVVINNLSPGLYSEFLTMEGCRSIYGISISKIIELYNRSISEGVPLDVLCDYYSEWEFLEMYDNLEEDIESEDDWEQEYSRRIEDEMNLEESWQYYNDDDAEDPYGRMEETEEQY